MSNRSVTSIERTTNHEEKRMTDSGSVAIYERDRWHLRFTVYVRCSLYRIHARRTVPRRLDPAPGFLRAWSQPESRASPRPQSTPQLSNPLSLARVRSKLDAGWYVLPGDVHRKMDSRDTPLERRRCLLALTPLRFCGALRSSYLHLAGGQPSQERFPMCRVAHVLILGLSK